LVIKGGQIHTITQGIIENGIILIQGDQILDIGADLPIPKDAEVLEFSGCFIMPGLISPVSLLGISSGTPSIQMPGAMAGMVNNAHYLAEYGIDPDNSLYRLVLEHGFTTIAFSPRSSGIGGLGAVVRFDGKTLNDIVLKDKAFLKVSVAVGTDFWNTMKHSLDEAKRKLEAQKKKEKKEKQKVTENKKDKKKKKDKVAKAEQPEKEKEEPPSEATKVFMEVMEGKIPILAECSQPAAIAHLMKLLTSYPKVKVVIRGGTETYKAGNLLKNKNIPVILEPAFEAKPHWARGYTTDYGNSILKWQSLGIKLAFQVPDNPENYIHLFDSLNILHLFGIKKTILLKGITLHPAEILGIDELVGSLEKGKKADMIIFANDPIENIPVIKKVILGGKFVQ
jgi:imidazolonepropionase-like amidohydrolase